MSKGFSLIETLIVLAMSVIFGALAMWVSMDAYRGNAYRADRDLYIATLQRARAQAISNVCIGTCIDGQPHGVHVDSGGTYVLFQGNAYVSSDANNVAFESSPIVTRSGYLTASDVFFQQLSGNTSCTTPCTITFTGQGGQSSLISISSVGQITWTN
jgi:prepilin-type N-terminal cleavage/methylation domain-containing protein